MLSFPERLQAAAGRLRDLQHEDGGWGMQASADAQRNVVSTAEALRVLRLAGARFDCEAAQNGLRYLAEKAPLHWQPRAPGRDEARGEHTRYAVYALLGLTAWPEAAGDDSLLEAQHNCVGWLKQKRVNPDGGWLSLYRESEGDPPPDERAAGSGDYRRPPRKLSPFFTSVAVLALSQIPPTHPTRPEATLLATEARKNVLPAIARKTPKRAWWPQTPGSAKPSAAVTAIATRALLTGDDDDRAVAGNGVAWLMSHRDEWATRVEPASDAYDANWSHFSYSLGLRAVAQAGVSVTDPRLTDALEYLDLLWDEEHGDWSHGIPGELPTPSGTHAVVAAHEALREAWPFDANVHILGRSTRRSSRRFHRQPSHSLEVFEDGTVILTGPNGARTRCSLTTRRWNRGVSRMLWFLAFRHQEGSAKDMMRDQTATAAEIAAACDISVDTVPRYKNRINLALRRAAEAPLGDLIVPMSDAAEAADRRWGLAVTSAKAPAFGPK